MLLFFISFFAGVLTVLAPCVLPLLPIIVGGSLSAGSRRRAYVITGSLGLSIIAFTLLLKASTAFVDIPQTFWQLFSGVILVGFGVLMIFPQLWEGFGLVGLVNRSSNKLLAEGYRRKSFWGDALMGAALGPVFTSCSPTYFVILATVLPASFAAGFIDLLAYAVGVSGFLLVIALLGQRLVDKLGVAIEPGGWFRRAIGVLFLVVGLGVATGFEAKLEVYLYDHGFDVTVVEQHLLGADNTSASPVAAPGVAATSTGSRMLTPEAKAMIYPKAPELAGIDGYINTPSTSLGQAGPITIGQFRGKKVVLVDFWTYSCINCIRTIPYVEGWYEKYKDQGLVVIGVHTPEFAFEHLYGNVLQATKDLGVAYPVVLDNEYATWNAFGNQFWPREYLIDIDGYIVHDHSGEGDYEGTERAIQKALAERALRLGLEAPTSTPMEENPQGAIPVEFGGVRSPETYFGAARNEYLGAGARGKTGTQSLSIPQSLRPNTLYLGGKWSFDPEYATNLSAGGTIRYLYSAKNVYLVVASSGSPVKIKVTRDGKPLPEEERGADLDAGSEATIREDRLYKLIQGADYGRHSIEIEVEGSGLQAYTFTFG